MAVAVATPTLSTAFRRTGTRAAVDEFISTHNLARSAAVRHGRTAELHIDANRFWVEVDTGTVATMVDTVGVAKNLDDLDVTLTVSPLDRDVLCFDARGLPTTRGACDPADATLTFTSGGKQREITITALGRVLR